MISASSRRVRAVRLRASDEALVRRGAILLEDALRTASVPDGGGRLLLVRRLDVGPIRTGRSPATLSVAIERSLARIGTIAVPGRDPRAVDSPVVSFRDRSEAILSLAVRVARGTNVAGWYWPLVVPSWRPGQPRDAALRTLLGATLALPAGAVAGVAFVRELLDHGVLAPLLEALRPPDGPALLRAYGLIVDATATRHSAEPERVAPVWAPFLARQRRIWGADDPRLVWLAATALAAERPTRLGDRRLAARAAGLIAQVAAGAEPDHRLDAPERPAGASFPTPRPGPSGHGSVPGSADGEPVESEPAGGGGPDHGPTTSARPDRGGTEHARHPASPSAMPTALPADLAGREPPRSPDDGLWQPTRAGGLFFVLPLLARLGIAGQLDAQPGLAELDVPTRLLRDVADRLGVPAGDPAVLVLDSTEDPPTRCPFVAPSTWASGLASRDRWLVRPVGGSPGRRVLLDGGLPLALWHGRAAGVRALLVVRPPLARDRADAAGPGPVPGRGAALRPRSDPAILLAAWRIAMRRWCRRYAGLTLRELILRPAWIAATPTHLDVRFHHAQAEARVRTTGLDLDPGWVPWFGRVVLFHYTDDPPPRIPPRDPPAATRSPGDDDA